MLAAAWGFLRSPLGRSCVLIAVLAFAAWLHGEQRHAAGVRETTAAFVKADKEGAGDVREIARKTLAGIGDNPDPDELLRRTGGLRDEPGNP